MKMIPMTPHEQALLPCPFCGDAAPFQIRTTGGWPAIQCSNCGTVGPCVALEIKGAVENWNLRLAAIEAAPSSVSPQAPTASAGTPATATAPSHEGVGQGGTAAGADWVRVPREPVRVDQTSFGQRGNCQSACLAMILGCPIADIPNFAEIADDNAAAIAQSEWLAKRGLALLTIVRWQALSWPPLKGFYIAGGMSKRGNRHGVIYKDGKLWHDPHPDRTGIESVDDVDFIYPIAPAFQARPEEKP